MSVNDRIVVDVLLNVAETAIAFAAPRIHASTTAKNTPRFNTPVLRLAASNRSGKES